MATMTTNEKLLFEEHVQLTGITDFGVSWDEFISGEVPIPPEGLRFDIAFEGEVTGEAVQGRITGTDYLTVRADGRLFLELHAEIITRDGARISVKESGINDQGALRLSMDFHTNAEKYKWINHTHVWGVGQVDFATGKVTIQGFKN